MRVIILGSTLAFRSAFAPSARKQQAETSEARNPREGPTRVTACLMAVDIMFGVIGFHEPLRNTEEIFVVISVVVTSLRIYLMNVSLFHLPCSMIFFSSTPQFANNVAKDDQIECVPTSCG